MHHKAFVARLANSTWLVAQELFSAFLPWRNKLNSAKIASGSYQKLDREGGPLWEIALADTRASDTASLTNMLSPNTILQNRYRVIRELGHGGMGTVYEALDQRVNCIVALKETIAGNNEEARRAFEREASLLGNLRHPALPKVMDYFSEDDGDFLIMEFIPGYDLAELLDLRGDRFPQAQAMRWADELLKVLEYLHGQQPPILHRDIKPSNLKLTKQGEIVRRTPTRISIAIFLAALNSFLRARHARIFAAGARI